MQRPPSSSRPPAAETRRRHLAYLAFIVAVTSFVAAPPTSSAPPAGGAAAKAWQTVVAERSRWWSLQAVSKQSPPTVKDLAWSRHPVDRFILAALEDVELTPASRADRHALLRRASFVLTGLPPTPEQIEAFINDSAPDAYERLVDRLLGSPHFGERWARHWMDVVRFGETHGHEWNQEVRGAWLYRDYLIRAFNQDLPFDQLVREHLAGDLLAQGRWNDEDDLNESPIGTAFYRFGEIDHDDCRNFPQNQLDVVDNQIDTFAKAFQATTVACARCHDHKLDAVSMRDYYALSGVLASSRQVAHTIDRPANVDSVKRKLREMKPAIRKEVGRLWTAEIALGERYLRAAHAEHVSDPRADSLAEGLSAERLQQWLTAIPGPRGKTGDAADDKDRKALSLDAVEFPWQASVKDLAEANDGPSHDLRPKWKDLEARYTRERLERRAFNAEHFVVLADFREGRPASWDYDGFAADDPPSPSGDFAVACEGDRAVHSVLRAGFYSNALSDRLNLSARSPVLPKDKKNVSLEVTGDRNGAWRSIYRNCSLQHGSARYLKKAGFRWHRFSTESDRPHTPTFLEFVTKFDNQAFPPVFNEERAELMDTRSAIGVTRVLLHDGDESPKDELKHMVRLFSGPAPSTIEDLATRYAEAMRSAVAAWTDSRASDADVRWIEWLLARELLPNAVNSSKRLETLVNRYRELEGQIAPPKLVVGMQDFRRGFDVPMLTGGEAHSPGEVVERGYITILGGATQTPDDAGSGRLALAKAVASAENPLTARVMVNRLWQHVFGNGLVRTADDFGHLGELPSHPELLDYLATRFVSGGWSVKRVVRDLVLTETFRMSSRVDATAEEIDPLNRKLHHYPLRRLEGEAIRDQILVVSGRLDAALYGPSIHPHRAQEIPKRRLFVGPLDGDGRRSIYTKVTLSEEPPFLSVFNLPAPKHARGRRDVTNVPAQALTLMNDPFVLEQANIWARELVREATPSTRTRLRRMFLTAIGRPGEAAELARFEQAIREFADLHEVPTGELLTNELVWTDVVHTLFNLKEFIYLR